MSLGESQELEALKQQVFALQERVLRIEQAIKAPANTEPSPFMRRTAERLNTAESHAMRAALDEYEDEKAIAHFRRCPSVARNIVKNSDMEAAFLRQRGFEPRQSKMEDLARQVVDELGEEEEDEEETETT